MLRRNRLIAVPPPERAVEFLAREAGSRCPGTSRRPAAMVGSPEKVRAGLEDSPPTTWPTR